MVWDHLAGEEAGILEDTWIDGVDIHRGLLCFEILILSFVLRNITLSQHGLNFELLLLHTDILRIAKAA